MHPIVADNLEAIRRLCQEHGVQRLYVFGSAATGRFVEGVSDVDFALRLAPEDERSSFRRYFGLKADLETLLGRPVDLVCDDAIDNPVFRRTVMAEREDVYAA